MKLIPALISATLLVSTTLPVAAQSKNANRKATAVTQRRTRPTMSVRRHKPPVTLARTSLVQTLPSGLSYIVTRRGEGRQPHPGEKVIVHYTGIMTNGVKFDSSLDRGQPFVFELGAGRVIKGWDEGIGKLKVGDQATLIIPPELAYGEKGRGPIPPNATLIFVIELVGIEEKPVSN
jgi:peptidylprolyl isomerase